MSDKQEVYTILLLIPLIFAGSLSAYGQQIDGMHVDETGKVGVGTDAPIEDLDVRGKLHVGTGLNDSLPDWAAAGITGFEQSKLLLRSEPGTGYRASNVVFENPSTDQRMQIELIQYSGVSRGDFTIWYGDHWYHHMQFMPNKELHLQRQKSALATEPWGGIFLHTDTKFEANVGIGTAPSSSYALSVNGSTELGRTQFLGNTTVTGRRFLVEGGGQAGGFQGGYDVFVIGPDQSPAFKATSTGSNSVDITHNGNYELNGGLTMDDQLIVSANSTLSGAVNVAGDIDVSATVEIAPEAPGTKPFALRVESDPVKAVYVVTDYGKHFRNTEMASYPDYYKSDDYTHLFWDRNTAHVDFSANDRAGFQYWDADVSSFHKLIDTGNMDRLDATFNTVTTTSLTETSSRRFKTDIRPIQNASDIVTQLNGVRYTWAEDARADIGFIAEEVGDVLPELVRYEENGVDAKSLDYSHLTAVLVEALKTEASKVDQLQIRVKELEEKMNQVEVLQKRLEVLERNTD